MRRLPPGSPVFDPSSSDAIAHTHRVVLSNTRLRLSQLDEESQGHEDSVARVSIGNKHSYGKGTDFTGVDSG